MSRRKATRPGRPGKQVPAAPPDPPWLTAVSQGFGRALCLLREGQDEAFVYEVTVTMGAFALTERSRSRIRLTFMRVRREGEE